MEKRLLFFLTKTSQLKAQKSFLNLLRLYTSPLFSFVISYFFIRWFSLSHWGEVSKYLLWVSIICNITNFGSAGYLMRQYSQFPALIFHNLSKAFYSRIPVYIICIIGVFFLKLELNVKLQFTLLIIIKTIQLNFETILHFERKYKIILLAETISTLVLFTLLFLAHTQRWDVFFILTAFLVFEILKLTIYIAKTYNQQSFSPFSIDYHLLRKFLPFFFLSLVGLLNLKSDQLFSSLHFNNEQVGRYQLISSFQAIGAAFFGALTQPFVRNIFRIKDSVYLKLFKYYLNLLIPLSFIITTGIYVAIEYIFKLEYHYLFFIVVCFNIIFQSLNMFLSFGLFKNGKDKTNLYINISTMAFLLCGALTIFSGMQELGLLISVFCSQFITFILFIYYNFYQGKKI